MTVLQNSTAENAIINQGEGSFRIFQPALGNGDIFSIDQSVRSIAVGPQSDFSRYTVYYFDPLTAQTVNLTTIDKRQPYVNDLKVRLDQKYTGTQAGVRDRLPGKLIVTPGELFIPSAFFTAPGTNTTFLPQIDLLFNTTPPQSISTARTPKIIRSALQLASAVNRVRIPVYGRKTWSVSVVYAFTTPNTITVVDLDVLGYRFSFPSGNTASDTPIVVNTLGATASMTTKALGNSVGMTYDAEAASANANNGARGYFDYIELVIEVDGAIDPSASALGGVQVFFDGRD